MEVYIKAAEEKQETVKPFLKWAGGKKWLSSIVTHVVPPGFNGTYFEPFLGAGAFFFALDPNKAVLSDINRELIDTYNTIKSDVNSVISTIQKYPYQKKFYYYMRSKKPRVEHARAARLLYLNRTCWNGLYRVNQKGEFNVPFGRYKNPLICNESLLRAVALFLQRAEILCYDFEDAVANARTGDFVYFDPPYTTGHQNNNFILYNNRLFSWADQERLAAAAVRLDRKGVFVLVSNADHANILTLYTTFYRYRIRRKSLIGGRGSKRGEITESLISSYPLKHGWLEQI